MKRSGPPKRVTPMRRTGMARKVVTAAVKPRKRTAGTDPTQKTRDIVHARSGGRCEWPGCPEARRDVHHRLDRGMGGRFGEMRIRLNQPAWLVDACRKHHEAVTNPVGDALALGEAMGWILPEYREGVQVDAEAEPILTRHWDGPVLLDNAGDWRVAA